MRRPLIAFSFLIITFTIGIGRLGAAEVLDKNFVDSIEKDNRMDGAMLKIHTAEPVNYAVYRIEEPPRIIIDPLGEIYSHYEEEQYFGTALIKSIRAIRAGGEPVSREGVEYYPLDFLSVELAEDRGYDTYQFKNDISIGFGMMRKDIAALKASKAVEEMIASKEAPKDEAAQEALEKIGLSEPEKIEEKIVLEKKAAREEMSSPEKHLSKRDRRTQARSLYKKGRGYYSKRQYATASRYFINALKVYPDHRAARTYLERAKKNLEKARKSEEKLKGLLDTIKEKEREVKRLKEGEAAVDIEAPKEKELPREVSEGPEVALPAEVIEEAPKEVPTEKPIRKLTRRQKIEKKKILKEEIRTLYYKGRELYKLGDYKGARISFKKILKIDPGEKEARELFGKAEGRLEAEKEKRRSR